MRLFFIHRIYDKTEQTEKSKRKQMMIKKLQTMSYGILCLLLVSCAPESEEPLEIVERLQQTMNDHDLEAFLDLIDEDYRSEQPLYPNRFFIGRDQVRQNWSSDLREGSDLNVEILRKSAEDNTVWIEWRWEGTLWFEEFSVMQGVTIFGIEDGKISWGRLYMDRVEQNE